MSDRREPTPNCISHGFWVAAQDDYVQFPARHLEIAQRISGREDIEVQLTEIASAGKKMTYPDYDLKYGPRGLMVVPTSKKTTIRHGWMGVKVSGADAKLFRNILSSEINDLKSIRQRNSGLNRQPALYGSDFIIESIPQLPGTKGALLRRRVA